MNDQKILVGFENLSRSLNQVINRTNGMGKSLDKVYLDGLTIKMMLDVLLQLLVAKGVFAQGEFDGALKELAAKTQIAMEEDAKKQAAAKAAAPPAGPPVTIIKPESATVH